MLQLVILGCTIADKASAREKKAIDAGPSYGHRRCSPRRDPVSPWNSSETGRMSGCIKAGAWKMKLSHFIRSHFDEITEWRSVGTQWSEIDKRIRSLELVTCGNSLRTLYYRELARRTSSTRMENLDWVNVNYQTIKDLRNQGYDWAAIFVQIPRSVNAPLSTPTLNMLIAEFNAIDKARSNNQSGHEIRSEQASQSIPTSQAEPLPVASPTTNETHVAPQVAEPASVPLSTVSDTKPLHDHSPASNRATEANQATQSMESKEEIRRQRQKARFQKASSFYLEQSARTRAIAAIPPTPQYPIYVPSEDPYTNKEELIEKISAAQARHTSLVNQYNAANKELEANPMRDISDWSEIDTLISKRNELAREADDAMYELDSRRADFFKRYGNARATQSNLSILSSAAIACGAYLVVDQESPGVICLYGFDRPPELAGIDELPDPLYLKSNLTNEELARIRAAYEQDAHDFPEFDNTELTKARLLTEALIVRGQCVDDERDPRIDQLKMVALTGSDCPSPALARTEYSVTKPPSIVLYPLSEQAEVRP